MLVISGPAGAGKGSVVAGLLARMPDLVLSISVTTRDPRPGERDGVHYRFVTPAEFARMEANGELLESADVHGHRYGTPRDQVERAVASGRTVVLEIDIQGARQVREAMPEALTVFIEAPDRATLEARLRGRGTESEAEVQRRLATAEQEMAQATWFDHRVLNDELEGAVGAVVDILRDTPETHDRGAH